MSSLSRWTASLHCKILRTCGPLTRHWLVGGGGGASPSKHQGAESALKNARDWLIPLRMRGGAARLPPPTEEPRGRERGRQTLHFVDLFAPPETAASSGNDIVSGAKREKTYFFKRRLKKKKKKRVESPAILYTLILVRVSPRPWNTRKDFQSRQGRGGTRTY